MAPTLEAIQRRAEAAHARGELFRSGLRTAYRWLDPAQYADMVGGAAASADQQGGVYSHIFDHTGPQSLEDGAGQIAEALHPQERPWVRYEPRGDLGDDVDVEPVKERADRRTEVTAGLLNRSNFFGEALKAHKDWLVGNAFLQVEQHPEERGKILCAAIPAWVWDVERDAYGRVRALFRRWSGRAGEVETRFATYSGVNLPRELRDIIEKEPDREVEIPEGYVWDAPGWRFWAWYGDEQILKTPKYRTCPIVAYASGLAPGRAYGTGPARTVVPTVKVLNKTVELILKNASIATTGMWQADDDGVLNPATVRLVPGAIIPKAPGSNGLQPLEPGGRFDVAQLVLDDMRAVVRRGMYVDKIDVEREMTLGEYADRREQIMRDLRGQYGVLKDQFVKPVIERVADLAEQMGLLERSDMDELAELELTGPLAEHVQGEEIERLRRANATVAEVYGPELAMAAGNAAKGIPHIYRQFGVDSELHGQEADLRAFQDEVRQMAMQLLAQQMAGAASE